MLRRILILGCLIGTFAPLAYAHGGGLDSLGCHHDRKNGGYHCHRGPLAGRSFASKAEAQKALGDLDRKQKPATQSTPSTESQRQMEPQERIVYVTRTGEKYHGPSCSYLRQSRIPISLKDAKKKGYTACSRCGGR